VHPFVSAAARGAIAGPTPAHEIFGHFDVSMMLNAGFDRSSSCMAQCANSADKDSVPTSIQERQSAGPART